MGISEPKCPYCGETMTAKAFFYDKYSRRYSGHAKCWSCGSQGPIAKGGTPNATINRAIKNALKRPLRKPLRWQQIEYMPVVWLEDNDKDDIIPAFPEPVKDQSVMCFLTAEQEFITAEKSDYGKRWRAWGGQPTEEERNETQWK